MGSDATLPANRDALRTLIDRLEAAECGSRELDAEIAEIALGDRNIRYGRGEIEMTVRDAFAKQRRDGFYGPEHVISMMFGASGLPAYTTSLDAALTLVPEGWKVTHAYWNDERAVFCLTKEVGIYAEGPAPTPALALCIASLKTHLAADCDGHSSDESDQRERHS